MDEDMIEVAMALEREVPYDTVGAVLKHNGYLDLLETMKRLSPVGYEGLRHDVMEREKARKVGGRR